MNEINNGSISEKIKSIKWRVILPFFAFGFLLILLISTISVVLSKDITKLNYGFYQLDPLISLDSNVSAGAITLVIFCIIAIILALSMLSYAKNLQLNISLKFKLAIISLIVILIFYIIVGLSAPINITDKSFTLLYKVSNGLSGFGVFCVIFAVLSVLGVATLFGFVLYDIMKPKLNQKVSNQIE